jgi:hypothetical protein
MKKQEALEFLSKWGVSSDIQEKCYEMTGGRIDHLKKLTVNLIDKRLSFEGNALI